MFSLKYEVTNVSGRLLAYYVFSVEDVDVKGKKAKKVIEELRGAMSLVDD